MTEYTIKDEGDLRKYYCQIPNMIDDMNLTPYAFRLYVHLKRVAAEDGTCWQSTTTLATSCKMSMGSISTAKNELVEAKLIIVQEVKKPGGGRKAHHITIIDKWRENMEKYATTSPHELATSPHEIKNNPIKNNPSCVSSKEEETRIIPSQLPKKRPLTERQKHTRQIEEEFVKLTKLMKPDRKTPAQCKAAQKLWWSPLDRMIEICQDDINLIMAILPESINRLSNLTIANPNSILKTFEAIYGEKKRNNI